MNPRTRAALCEHLRGRRLVHRVWVRRDSDDQVAVSTARDNDEAVSRRKYLPRYGAEPRADITQLALYCVRRAHVHIRPTAAHRLGDLGRYPVPTRCWRGDDQVVGMTAEWCYTERTLDAPSACEKP